MILLSRSEEIILLAIWKLKENAYGVTIREQVSNDTGHDWTFGAIYKPLKQLYSKGFVAKTMSEPFSERGGRSKFLYNITVKGGKALKEIRKINESVWSEESKLAFD
ncbi:MAG: PadR family transcriptional regulator [bacterium]|nr:PadR family transcriptional regulator [bacterium]